MALHGFTAAPFWLALAGVVLAWFCYLVRPQVPEFFARTFRPIYVLLENKYYFDRFNEVVFAGGARLLGRFLWQIGDRTIIDGAVVNGSAAMVGEIAGTARSLQTGRLYHYAFAMIVGMVVLLWFIYRGH